MPRIAGLRRLFRLTDSAQVDPHQVDDELHFHIESRIDELVAGGHPDLEAREMAEREFGDWGRYRDDVLTIDHHYAREIRMREFIESVGDDVRHAARALRAQPGFSLVAVLTLAMGIGASTSVFSVVSGVLLRPLPYVTASRIVHIGEREADKPGRGSNTSYDNFTDWQRLARSFEAIGLYNTWQSTLTGRGDPQRVEVAGVTAGVFNVFHVKPVLGRAFTAADNMDNAAAVAVVGYDFWRSRLGGNPAIIGQNITLNFTPIQVIGVLPEGFVGPRGLARPIWINFSDDTDGRAGRSKNVYALLRSGVSLEAAQSEMQQISAQLTQLYPKENKGSATIVDRVVDLLVGDLRRPLYMLLGASFVVLLIACANLSNLLLARGVTRSRELAVRAALGAGRTRIIRQLLTESVLLAVIGSTAGVSIAYVATRQLLKLGPAVFETRPPAMDLGVLACAIAMSVGTTLLFGLLPALRGVPRDPQATLRASSSRAAGGQTARTRNALAVMQLSLAVVLLSASTMVIKSFARVLRIEPGIRGDHLLTLSLNLPRARYDSSKSTAFYAQLEQRLTSMPDVRGVAFTSLVPFGGDFDRISISKIVGESEHAGNDAPEGDRYVVSPGYFATMGVRLVKGRLFDADDRYDGLVVCLVDEVFARRTWGAKDPIGKQMKLPARPDFATIVGVVTHVKTYGLDVDSPGQIYMSNVQYPWRWMSMVVRTTGAPEAFVPAVTRAVHELDPDEPLSAVKTMDAMMSDLLHARRFTLTLLATFAAVAITLAVLGLYGVIAYGVSQRRREFGIRMALGAQQGHIARMVIGEGGRIGLFGAAFGALGALATSRLISSLLFEVNARDVTVLALVSIGLVCVSMLACVLPARRATRVDAVEVLRGD
jgi:predicted permease